MLIIRSFYPTVLTYEHHRYGKSVVSVLAHRQILQGFLERREVWVNHWSASSFSAWPSPFLTIYTTSLSLIKNRHVISCGNLTTPMFSFHLCLPFRHFVLDIESHLQLNLVISAIPLVDHHITVQLDLPTLMPTRTVRNLVVLSDDQLTFHILKKKPGHREG